ncbi:MAG: tRNA pseudouridine(38-40) synthase TruA [Coriobacteriales bacterium]|jgi:tRNA pseudouridine38-40 synthase|nr:tRNA pseudouridine(38-40) synthase TruA [Coriobacteriales bacterium]
MDEQRCEPINESSGMNGDNRGSEQGDRRAAQGDRQCDNRGDGRRGGGQSNVLALTVAYNGADFHGFARQPGQTTVQGELERALATLFRHEVQTTGAGRTDAGVHALGQVVSFALSPDELQERSLSRLRNSLNALTPDGIVVRAVEEKPADFSARFSAIEREYRYRFVFGEVEPLFLRPYAWWVPTREPIDVQAMKQAAPLLVGEHDFASFCVAASAVDKNTVRKVLSVTLFGTDHLGESCLVLQVRGTAFLHSMVRVIAGSMLEVGLVRREPQWLSEVLAARNRTAAAQTAPAHGLTLWRVRY